ncbi:MAG: hypothetical protein CMM94_08240 [Rickettsiales bacterium]|nr:hypothetical protein [Rickettsiales bacterium]|tara:strand:- start:550 stop:1269 length:720 start_codon:yes stop_codon:yes gene_type:complete
MTEAMQGSETQTSETQAAEPEKGVWAQRMERANVGRQAPRMTIPADLVRFQRFMRETMEHTKNGALEAYNKPDEVQSYFTDGASINEGLKALTGKIRDNKHTFFDDKLLKALVKYKVEYDVLRHINAVIGEENGVDGPHEIPEALREGVSRDHISALGWASMEDTMEVMGLTRVERSKTTTGMRQDPLYKAAETNDNTIDPVGRLWNQAISTQAFERACALSMMFEGVAAGRQEGVALQ